MIDMVYWRDKDLLIWSILSSRIPYLVTLRGLAREQDNQWSILGFSDVSLDQLWQSAEYSYFEVYSCVINYIVKPFDSIPRQTRLLPFKVRGRSTFIIRNSFEFVNYSIVKLLPSKNLSKDNPKSCNFSHTSDEDYIAHCSMRLFTSRHF
jgi:hypothetical protein